MRPRKTQEELDAEMEDYWGENKDGNSNGRGEADGKGAVALNGNETVSGNVGIGAADVTAEPVGLDDGDIEMIE